MRNTVDIEAVKNFWDARPCNIRHSSKEVGTMAYFNEVEEKKHFVEPHIIPFADFPSWKGKRVLEVGCGLGTAAVNFVRHGAEYTGIDLSTESLALAKKRFEVYGYSGTFIETNAEELTKALPNKKFDLIYSFGVIHHTPRPNYVIEQCSRLLDQKGTFKLMMYAKNSWKNQMIEAGLDQPEAQTGCPIAFTYSHSEIRDLLFPYFRVESIVQDHIFPYQIEPYKRGEYVKEPWFAAMPETMFKTLEKNLGWHLLITAKLTGA